MITGQQLWIFKNIGSLSYSREEKLNAIQAVVRHDSYNNVFKEDMWQVIRYLLKVMEESKEVVEDGQNTTKD